ncbi:MAG: tetratricopeptide repeat-containing sulfotransferase family protein, partial [Gammaproteobacteria bacterium]
MVRSNDSAKNQARHLYEEGLARLNTGDVQTARDAFARALTLDDSLAMAHYQLGNCLRQIDETSAAEQALRAAIARDPGLADAYFSLVFLLRDQGRVSEIDGVLTAMAEALPEDAKHIEQAAGLLAEYGRIGTALDLFERAVSQRPLARLYMRIGQMQQILGQFAQSSSALETALQHDPNFGAAYLLLAHNRRAIGKDDTRLGLYQSRLADAKLPDNTRICLHFALGKLLDDLGDFPAAFQQYQAGNQLRRQQGPYDRATWEWLFETQHQMPWPQTVASGHNHPTPVFIIGMLRSGTTLVERMLSNHPDIHALGETEMVDRLAEALAQQTGVPYPVCLRGLTAENFAELAHQYRARWPRETLQARYVLDKNPLNFMHLGLILQLFPDA